MTRHRIAPPRAYRQPARRLAPDIPTAPLDWLAQHLLARASRASELHARADFHHPRVKHRIRPPPRGAIDHGFARHVSGVEEVVHIEGTFHTQAAQGDPLEEPHV